MTDQQIIQALIDRNDDVTEQFFFKDCRPLFVGVIRQVFVGHDIDYDEFVNELYIHIMENDAQRLRQFQGRSTVYQWLKVVAIHYFWAKRKKMIEESRNEALPEEFDRQAYIELATRMGLNPASIDRTVRKWCNEGKLENPGYGKYRKA